MNNMVFTDLTLFVCTYVAKLKNINISFIELSNIISKNLTDEVIAINSNYSHASNPGFEHFIKKPKKSNKEKTRKIQGDGTCFNSAIEPVIKLPSGKEDKFYFIKCFPTTGETQIPGVINPDLSDGHDVLVILVNYFNKLNLGTNGKLIEIQSENPKMLNYKFRLVKDSERVLINLFKLSDYLIMAENEKFNINSSKKTIDEWIIVHQPFLIKEVKSAIDDIKVSFKMQTDVKKAPRINIFQGGKINILGANNEDSIKLIYQFLTDLFKNNWNILINIKPEKDNVN